VVSIPDPVFGEQICAVVQLALKAQATAEELRQHVAGYGTRFCSPSLPKNNSGKIAKREPREKLAAEGVAN
jgi:acyl-coenzyme A synthetase/AMP-(fatty) acid ligase